MGIRDAIRRVLAPEEVAERAVAERLIGDPLAFQSWVDSFGYAGNVYPFRLDASNTLGSDERVSGNFVGYAGQAFAGNPIVHAAIAWRMRTFSEARFMWQRIRDGRPGDLFATKDLAVLERPQPTWTTGDLLARMEMHASLAGTAFVVRRRLRGQRAGSVFLLRPDWVTIISGVRGNRDSDGWAVGAEVLGIAYQPGGPAQGRDYVFFGPDEVAIYAPIPDPTSPFRGQPWLHSILTELNADIAASVHKLKFYEQGATVGLTVVLEAVTDPKVFDDWVTKFNDKHQGVANAWRTLFLSAGAKPYVIGTNLEQQAFATTQGKGETRILMAAGVHPVVVGASEGMQGSSLNAGNYAAAKRAVADTLLRPLWRNAAGSLEPLMEHPGSDARLWYDARDIPFLRDDATDEAKIRQTDAATIKALVDSGWRPDDAVRAVTGGDLKLLIGSHTGKPSVQLQQGGNVNANGSANGNGEASPNGDGQTPEEVPTT